MNAQYHHVTYALLESLKSKSFINIYPLHLKGRLCPVKVPHVILNTLQWNKCHIIQQVLNLFGCESFCFYL